MKQASDSVMYGYFCIGFIDFMLAGKKLTDYTNLFSPHDLKKKRWYNFVLFQKWIKIILLNIIPSKIIH